MKKILAAVDFSESSVNATKYALQLARNVAGASLTLYYTYEIITPGSDGTPLLVDSEARKAVALTALNNLKAELGDAGNVVVEIVAEAGSFTASLEKYVAHVGIDLVIMGITGSTRLEQIIIGSNTLNVINKDICPVLIVPAGVSYRPIKTAALTTDLKDVESTTPVKTLASFLNTFHPELYVAHVAMEAGAIPESEIIEKEKLQVLLQQYSPRYFYIREEDFTVAIDKFVEEYHPDIIITVPREHSFLSRLFKESYTKKLAYNSNLPILAIHSKHD